MPGPVRLVVCINARAGAGRRSCIGSGSLDQIDRIDDMISGAGLDIPILRRECPGRCEQGPTRRIAPGGPFFTETDATGLKLIVAGPKQFIDRRNGTDA
ncbi:MAG: hypothetical protein OEN02_05810 [Gammaproteobacteria bacterium]|nr:hypothetical protein [Gammaproteobacteria bacterium]MDH3536138.1 hypothetical protein [Gammaproteobacteria bacterium]